MRKAAQQRADDHAAKKDRAAGHRNDEETTK